MKRIFLFLSLFCSVLTQAQPVEMRKVFQASWQQQVNVDIRVSLDDQHHVLRGEERVVYINKSPDALSEIWIHLWPNAYKHDSTPFAVQELENNKTAFYFSDDNDRGYIDSLLFTVDGNPAEIRQGASEDIIYIKLSKMLAAGDSCVIRTPFRVKIPQSFSRLGHVGQSYQITQWFPKPAVYDVNGWNPIPYLDQGEFYSEFGDFSVTINLPDSYVVATSGRCVAELKAAGRKTLKFYEKNIHDFAWFADKHYKIDSADVYTEDGHKIACYMYFKKVADNNLEAIKKAVLFRSKKIGNYPYDHIAAVASSIKAGAGMEYPCITVVMNGDEMTIEHEVGHNWFYGILASYEREYAYMDEGFNTYYDLRYAAERQDTGIRKMRNWLGFPYTSAELEQRALNLFQLADHEEQPIYQSSANFTFLNYAAMVYGKTAICLRYLEHYLGTARFDSIMMAYYQTWKFKHPLPGDLKQFWTNATGENLDWFFESLLKTNDRIDYKILGIYRDRNRPGIAFVDVENIGKVKGPLFFGAKKGDSVSYERIYDGFEGIRTFALPDSFGNAILLDPFGISPEVNRMNNVYVKNKWWPRNRPLKMRFMFGLSDPGHKELCWLPAIAYNAADGMMAGLALYNQSVFSKPTSFLVMPMFGTRSNSWSGMASLTHKVYFENEQTKSIELKIDLRKFSFSSPGIAGMTLQQFVRFAPEANVLIAPKSPRSTVSNAFNLKYIYLGNYQGPTRVQSEVFFNTEFRHKNERTINPNGGSFSIQVHQVFQKIQAEWSGAVNLNAKNKDLRYRFFGAFMYYNKLLNPAGIDERYSLKPEANGGYWDYTREQLMFNRDPYARGFRNAQLIAKDGFFKTPYNFGYISDTWLTAANFKCPLPGKKIPIELYADVSFFNSSIYNVSQGEVVRTPKFIYGAGISLVVIRDVFEIYFPLVMSKEMQQAIDYKNTGYMSKISWLLNLHELNPFYNKRRLLKLMNQ